MNYKQINEIAQKDHRTLDISYNHGLSLIKKYGYECVMHDVDVQYWMMCNGLLT